MRLQLHPDIRICKLTIGKEKVPLLVVDNFMAGVKQLVEVASDESFAKRGRYYPGLRAAAPLQYKQCLLSQLGELLIDYFQLRGQHLALSMCHYSLVTTPPHQLKPVQRIPHIDSVERNGLASIHYLFDRPLGGTAFYRHRATGFETVDAARQRTYFESLQKESADPRFPGDGYINSDTPFFERIHAEEGVFNRMLVYHRNSLHSGSIGEKFVPDSKPWSGRLSINSFIDVT